MSSASILVLTKNGAKDIGELLQRLYGQTATDRSEVILVDSGSSDATLQIARSFPVRVEHIPADMFHHARTRNFAASLASGEILIFLSQDAIPVSDTWLTGMLANFDDPTVGAVYGRQIPREGASPERQDALDTLYGEHRMVKDPTVENRLGYRFYHFSDANAALRRSVWQATGFPEELKVFEDLGIAKRILDGGWRIVYEPKAAVYHSHKHSALTLFRRYFDIGYTLQHLQIWGAEGVGGSILKEGKRAFRRKLSASSRRRSGALPVAIGKECAKSLGLVLGLKHRYLPLLLKKHLSHHGIYSETSAAKIEPPTENSRYPL